MDLISIKQSDFEELRQQLSEIKNLLANPKKVSPLGEEWMDNQIVCQVLHISKRTLQEWRATGKIPFSQHQAKIWYRASDIQEFLQSHYNKAFNKPHKSF